MALVSFGYRVDMYAIDPPLEVGAYIVAYDLDGVLKQKDHLGVVTLVGSGAGGPQGPPGPVGPAGLTWSGAWMATQSYSQNYAVGYDSASWWCISDVVGATSNSAPDVDTTHWTLLAAQGSPGSQGGTGSQGLQGPQGEIGLNWIGDWIVNVYDVRDVVYYNGSSYVCIASTVGSETISPDTNMACWEPLALKGDVGPAGATGPQGPIGLTGPNGDSYWIATGSNIININNSTVIVSGPTAPGGIAIKSPDFIGAAELTGFGIYNSGTVAGAYFYGSWFNSAPGYGLQDFTAQTKFYIDATTFNWISNKPITIGTGTASDSRFLVSSSGGTTSLVVTEMGSVYNRDRNGILSNLAFGLSASISNTTGISNTAIGNEALYSNTNKSYNVAIGSSALYNSNADYNVAIGESALFSNTTGTQNNAIGGFALYYNVGGSYNTAIGIASMQNGTQSQRNTGIGGYSLYNTTGSRNIGIGFFGGSGITTGSDNTVIGSDPNNATDGITTGSRNTFIGKVVNGIKVGDNNTILGRVSGLASGLTNSVILADGSGNIRFYSDSNGNSAIGNTSPTASAIFQIDSTTKGFLPPRMTNTERTSISSPAIGLIVYCTDVTEGLYVYKSTGWQFIA